jgi:hypothetical protein
MRQLKPLTDCRSPCPRPTLTELTMIIRWWMRVVGGRSCFKGAGTVDQDQKRETD